MLVTASLVILALLCTQISSAGANEAIQTAKTREVRLAWFQDLSQAYAISRVSPGNEPLEIRSEPVLRWNSAQAGIHDGAVFLWLHEQRPCAVSGPFWAPQHGGLYVQFHSLAEEPLTAKHLGSNFWAPSQGGISWNLVPDAPKPASTQQERLMQMRLIARRFTASAVKGPPNYDPGSKWQLRLMPQPLYRYASIKQEVVDGGLFALALGTDPELFLLLEVQLGTEPVWRYALAPWCESELQVEYRGQRVWERAHLRGWDPHASYFRTGPTTVEPPIGKPDNQSKGG